MHRWTAVTEVPAGFGPSVVTIGNFDGVHRGHTSVLSRMVAGARANGLQAVAVTFSPHPAQVHRPDSAPELLTGDADRLELLEATGLDAVLMLEYTLDFARQTPEEFVRRYLVDALGARTVVVGRDVRFGRRNSGDIATMVDLGRAYGFAVEVVADVAPEASHRRWSSTWVRELLAAGDARGAARVLGRPHRMRGVVVHGDARGRGLGFPTANLSRNATGMVPADGVYAGRLRLAEAIGAGEHGPRGWPAAVSVGTNPTFDGAVRRVEAYVLGRTDLDLYDREVVVEFVAQLRPTQRFDSVDDLVAQMRRDVERVPDALAHEDAD
ncbi:MAG: bifunctional riboflavin kinase/FAD synthetase [Cellulomonas sp.]